MGGGWGRTMGGGWGRTMGGGWGRTMGVGGGGGEGGRMGATSLYYPTKLHPSMRLIVNDKEIDNNSRDEDC
ncbi:unnamed protein product [Rotaria socialis]|nr:unnamed protein product [Rotaria socialis]